MNYFKEYAPALLANNFEPLCLYPYSKTPSEENWNHGKITQTTIQKQLLNGCGGEKDFNVGVRTNGIAFLDSDIEDEDISNQLWEFIKEMVPNAFRRIGSPPRFAIPFKTKEKLGNPSSKKYVDLNGVIHGVELRGSGQVVVYGKHPKTRKEFSYPDGKDLLSQRPEELPEISNELFHKVLQKFYSIAPNDWELKGQESSSPPLDPDDWMLRFKKPISDLDTPKILKMIHQLDPDADYNQWIRVGMALYHQYQGDPEGLEIWAEWSMTGPKFKQGECHEKWPSFKANLDTTNPVTARTLIHLTKESPESNTAEVQTFSFVSQFLSKDYKPDWLIKNFLEKNSLSQIFGEPGTHKTFIALGLMFCVATGRPWNGFETFQGPVVMLCGEGKFGLGRRLQALFSFYKVNPKDIPLLISDGPADLSDPKAVGTMVSEIMTLLDGRKPVLVAVDTVARNFGPGDENSTSDMGAVIRNLDFIKEKFQSAILLIHHTGHTNKDRARGAKALFGALDNEFKCERVPGSGLTVKLKSTKCKDFEPPQDLYLEGRKILVDFDEGTDSLIFEKAQSQVEEEKAYGGKLGVVYELISKFADHEKKLCRDRLKEVAGESGISPCQLRKKLNELKAKEVINYDTKSVRLRRSQGEFEETDVFADGSLDALPGGEAGCLR